MPEKKEQVIGSIRQKLRSLKKNEQREILWQLLQGTITSDDTGIKWIMEELGLFLDREVEQLRKPFKKA